MSVAVDGFPNFFSMLGPNSGVASGSLTKIIEATGDYITKCVRKVQKENIWAMHISPRATRDWLRYVDAYFPRTVFLDNCKTWYRKNNRVVGLWPGSTLHAIETLRSPRWEDYEYVYADEDDNESLNRLAWLGNGWTEIQYQRRRSLLLLRTGECGLPCRSTAGEDGEMDERAVLVLAVV
ncbi:hypothetical protein PV04_10520 [Phialophora macrospora]|uniref:Uncharacterized protein n=1 Tax=Phialophora macrospora TaxID=1851006 RepID=A0A0D2FQP9_9EURO|nr:hypothetical protein PV04_10520 [Phialophora macrospora]